MINTQIKKLDDSARILFRKVEKSFKNATF